METKKHDFPPENDADATMVVPRFDEQSEVTARPVVPLARTTDSDVSSSFRHGQRVTAGSTRKAWPHGLTLVLAVVAAATLGAAVAYRSARETAPLTSPSAAAQQTSTETTIDKETTDDKETADDRASTPPSTQNVSTEVSVAPVREARESEERGEPTARDEPEKRDGKEAERRERDAEKRVERAGKDEERARHEEEKIFERRRKEAEKLAERRDKEKGGEQKGGEHKARLVGVLTDKPEP